MAKKQAAGDRAGQGARPALAAGRSQRRLDRRGAGVEWQERPEDRGAEERGSGIGRVAELRRRGRAARR